MGVRGLSTYIHEDSRNFRDWKLHNTFVVFDAHNIVNFFYINSGLYTQFNGEYASFVHNITQLINSLRHCSLKPIFVFDGCHLCILSRNQGKQCNLVIKLQPMKLHTQMHRNHQRMQTTRNLLKLINNQNLDCTDSRLIFQILPPLAVIVFAETLLSLRVPYVTSDREGDQDAVSLAIYLNCPVVSNDSDFFITIPIDISIAYFIPLSLVSLVPIIESVKCHACKSKNRTCAYISCKTFVPNGPGLKELPAVQRPLLASLLGNDYISPDTFLTAFPISPDLATPLSNSATKEMRLKRRKTVIQRLINWLTGFGTNIDEPVERLLARFPKDERVKLRSNLIESMENYSVRPNLVFSMFEKYIADSTNIKLNDDSEGPMNLQDFSRQSSTSSLQNKETLSTDRKCSVSDTFRESSICNDVTFRWPDKLIWAYRKYQFIPNYLDSLFCHGLVLVCGIESLYDTKSMYKSATPIRSLLYNLILGVELPNLEGKAKFLIGLEKHNSKYSVIEYNRRDAFRFQKYKLMLEPCVFDTPNNFICLFENHMGFKPNTNESAFWLDALSIVSVQYFRSNLFPDQDKIMNCSVVLAFGAICVTSYILQSQTDKLHKAHLRLHYENCANYFTSHPNTRTEQVTKLRSRLHMNFVHAIGELQAIYAALISVVSVMSALVTPNESNVDMPQVSTVFPSGYLFHEIVHSVHVIDPSLRCDYVRDSILAIISRVKDKEHSLDTINLFNFYTQRLTFVQENLSFSVDDLCKKPNECVVVKNVVQTQVKNSNIQKPKKSIPNRKHRPFNKISKSKQLSHDEVERIVSRLMLENDLSDE